MYKRQVYAVGIQLFGDLLETVSVKVKLEDQPDGVGGFFNDHDLPGVLVLEVTEGRDDHDPFFLLLPIGGTYLPAGILGKSKKKGSCSSCLLYTSRCV